MTHSNSDDVSFARVHSNDRTCSAPLGSFGLIDIVASRGSFYYVDVSSVVVRSPRMTFPTVGLTLYV